jgi:hypothetical protein
VQVVVAGRAVWMLLSARQYDSLSTCRSPSLLHAGHTVILHATTIRLASHGIHATAQHIGLVPRTCAICRNISPCLITALHFFCVIGPMCNTTLCIPACVHGSCLENNQCLCQAGWFGTACNFQTDICALDAPCQNNATCTTL